MTNKSPIKTDGSVDIEFLESECTRLAEKKKQVEENKRIMRQIENLNDIIEDREYVSQYHFNQAILVLADLESIRDGNSTQKAIFKYIERHNDVRFEDMSDETRIDLMNLVCKAIPSGIVSYDAKAHWFYRTGNITPSEIIASREAEEAAKYKDFIGKLKKFAANIW